MPEYVPKLVHLPGTKLSPEVVLHRTMAKLEHIKSIAVVIEWNDESTDLDWSQMTVGRLILSAAILDTEAKRILTAPDDDGR